MIDDSKKHTASGCSHGRLTRTGRSVMCRADLCGIGEFTVPSPSGVYGVRRDWCEERCPIRLAKLEAQEGN